MVTEDDCVAGIQQVAEILGHSPSKPEYLQIRDEHSLNVPHPSQIYRYCGGWNDGKEMAGVETVNPGGAIEFNEHYFSEIDTGEKAYWLGFLYGDGWVDESGEGSPQVAVFVQKSDSEIIEEFGTALNSKHKIQDRDGKTGLSICDWRFAYDLAKLGLSDEKTFNDALPPLSETRHRAAFIRGLFDADGHLGQYGRFNITGSNKSRFECLGEWLPVESTIVNRGDGVYTFRVGGSHRLDELYNFLYPDGEETQPALTRKKIWKQKKPKNT